jgi:hypothetical protein
MIGIEVSFKDMAKKVDGWVAVYGRIKVDRFMRM